MEFGGIGPIGLPNEWPIFVDQNTLLLDAAILGSGVRKSKLIVSGAFIATLPGVQVLDGLARRVD